LNATGAAVVGAVGEAEAAHPVTVVLSNWATRIVLVGLVRDLLFNFHALANLPEVPRGIAGSHALLTLGAWALHGLIRVTEAAACTPGAPELVAGTDPGFTIGAEAGAARLRRAEFVDPGLAHLSHTAE